MTSSLFLRWQLIFVIFKKDSHGNKDAPFKDMIFEGVGLNMV
jgi:hypothetical protein